MPVPLFFFASIFDKNSPGLMFSDSPEISLFIINVTFDSFTYTFVLFLMIHFCFRQFHYFVKKRIIKLITSS